MQAFETYGNVTQAFKLMYEKIEDTNKSLRIISRPKQCYLTTMTFVATLSSRDLIIHPRVIEDLCSGEDDEYFTSITRSAFSPSCIEFHSETMPSVKIKLFNKGSLQITGCKTHLQAMHSIVEVCRVMSLYAKSPIDALTMGIALININVETHTGINLTRCAQTARSHRILAEQPERPPSCILKIPRDGKMTTVLVYKSGKFTICAPSPGDAHMAYAAIMRILDTENVIEPKTLDALKRGKSQFTWTQLVQCGMPGLLHTHAITYEVSVPGCLRCKLAGNWFAPTGSHQT